MSRYLEINLTVELADEVTEEQIKAICDGPAARISSREKIILDGRQVVLDWGFIEMGDAFDWANVDGIQLVEDR